MSVFLHSVSFVYFICNKTVVVFSLATNTLLGNEKVVSILHFIFNLETGSNNLPRVMCTSSCYQLLEGGTYYLGKVVLFMIAGEGVF